MDTVFVQTAKHFISEWSDHWELPIAVDKTQVLSLEIKPDYIVFHRVHLAKNGGRG